MPTTDGEWEDVFLSVFDPDVQTSSLSPSSAVGNVEPDSCKTEWRMDTLNELHGCP